MKISLTIIYIVLSNFCFSQVDYSEDWANSGWIFRNESDTLVDVSKRVVNEIDLKNVIQYQYPGFNEESKIIPFYGVLGGDFNKIEIVFSEVLQDYSDSSKYNVIGKSRLNNIVYELKGSITFENATAYIPENKEEQTVIVLVGSYVLTENLKEDEVSRLIGNVKLILFTDQIDKDSLLFDSQVQSEDGAVKGFVGVRVSNDNNTSQSCIWGFQRFPYEYAKNFDIGDGEEVINVKYAKPWFDYSEKDWKALIYDQNNTLHSTDKDKGIHTSNKEYIKPEEASWYKLSKIDLVNKVIEELGINPGEIANELIVISELDNNETIILIPEIENDNSQEEEELSYKLTSHVMIVNSVSGKIKNHYSEKSEVNGWVSNALMLTDIGIDTNLYKISESVLAFGVRVNFRGSSQPNPYYNTSFSLYTIEKDTIRKVLSNLDVHEFTGEVNVSSCGGKVMSEDLELTITDDITNGYYDILLRIEITNTVFEIDSDGECEDVNEKNATTQILIYDTTSYIKSE